MPSSKAPSPLFPLSPALSPIQQDPLPPLSLTSTRDALKVVKLLEGVLAGWNEYRQVLAASAKAGQKLSKAFERLGNGVEDGSVVGRTLHPSAMALGHHSEVMRKMAREVDREYEAINAEAAKYFSTLAKENKSHEAYINVVSKKHDKADKAYKKTGKSHSSPSIAHTSLLSLKSTLAEDLAQANYDHLTYLSAKQASLLYSVAARAGRLGSGLTSCHGEGLKLCGGLYGEIEYFRVLADIQWKGSLPTDLEEMDEAIHREEVRAWKDQVNRGEADIVGRGIWEDPRPGPERGRGRMMRMVSESILGRHPDHLQRPVLIGNDRIPSYTSNYSLNTVNTNTSTGTTSQPPTTDTTNTSPSEEVTLTPPRGDWGVMQTPKKRNAPFGARPLPPRLPSSNDLKGQVPSVAAAAPVQPMARQSHVTRGSGSISIPAAAKTVSEIAAQLESLSSSLDSQSKSGIVSAPPPRLGARRVTIPPTYSPSHAPPIHPRENTLSSVPVVQPRRGVTPQVPRPGPGTQHRAYSAESTTMVSPTPRRVSRLSPVELERRVG